MHPRFLTFLVLVAATPAFAQIESREGIALQNQILELRQDMQQLQQLQNQASGAQLPVAPPMSQGPQGAAPDNDTTAQLVVRVAELEEQVRALQGKVEELSNQLQRQNDDLTKQIGDLAFKAGQGGAPAAPQDGGAPPPSAPTLQPAPISAPPAPRKTPELMLKEGNAALARHDYAGAEAAARQVLAAAPGPRQGDAQFLLARAQSGQHQYQGAAASFYAIYTRAPKSPRAPEALLGVTDSLLALNDNGDACQALAKIAAEFPHADPAIRARAAASRKRAACR